MKNLIEILKNVPSGTKLWCDIYGEMTLVCIDEDNCLFPIIFKDKIGSIQSFTKNGAYGYIDGDECPCVIWPDKNTRTWDNYKLPVKKKLSKPAIISSNLKQFLEENTDYYSYTNSKYMNNVLKWLREIYGLYLGIEVVKEIESSYEGITNVRIMYKPSVFSELNEERRVFNFSSNKWNSAVETGIIETIKYFIKH